MTLEQALGPVELSPNLGWPELEALALGEHVLRAESELRACAGTPFKHELHNACLVRRCLDLMAAQEREVWA